MKTVTDPLLSTSILLVEDEQEALDVLTTVLARRFSDVVLHTATNGRKGLELFQTHQADIVITDINMPDMTGVQMAGKIRTIKPDTRFIILTGDTGKLTLEAAIGDGLEIDHYIVKPIRLKELFAAIDQCFCAIAKLGEISHLR